MLPVPYIGHPILERAREIAGRAWYGTVLYDPIREDAAGVAVVAILEGVDPVAAVRSFMQAERGWRLSIGPILPALEAALAGPAILLASDA